MTQPNRSARSPSPLVGGSFSLMDPSISGLPSLAFWLSLQLEPCPESLAFSSSESRKLVTVAPTCLPDTLGWPPAPLSWPAQGQSWPDCSTPCFPLWLMVLNKGPSILYFLGRLGETGFTGTPDGQFLCRSASREATVRCRSSAS